MADNIQKQMIEQFTNVTGVDDDRAKFFLESSAWNLEVAMASFYEGDGDDEPPPATGAPAPGDRADPGSGRFGIISNMDEDSSDSDEEGQGFYVGGSETSGQQVLGPPKKKKDNNVVEDLFKSAKEHGAEVVDKSEKGQKLKARPAFKGTGYRLGETEESSDVVAGSPVTESPRQIDIVLKLWKDGFSVDDGPLRDYKDGANKDFLDSISRGEVPRELIRMARGGEVSLNMEDHRTEDYVKPKVAMKAFTGEGHMLGSPAPNVVSAMTSPSASAGSASQSSAQQSVSVDDSRPSTSIQIRLADGQRMVAKFNHSHRISDIRTYITTAHPQYASTNFVLQTTFPNKELTNESQTLEEAKLLNAVIVQRLK